MDSLLDKFISSGGPLVAFVIVVYFLVSLFLKHLATQADLDRGVRRELHNDNLSSMKETREVLGRLTGSVDRNTDATSRLSTEVSTIKTR